MSNKKFSEFTLQTDNSNVAFVVGFNGSDNVRISPSNLIGSGFLPTSGGTMTGNLLLQDNIQVQIGTGADLKLYHNGTDSFIENQTGILKIQSYVVDGDISFLADNGSGTATEYFRLDGSDTNVRFLKDIKLSDGVLAMFGSNNDLLILHDGTDSKIHNDTGHLIVEIDADDKDFSIFADDQSGGLAEYFRVDGSLGINRFIRDSRHNDSVKANFGDSDDLQIYHNGTNSLIDNTVGDISIRQLANDKDIRFRCDDGSGGETEYFRVDGSQEVNVFSKNIKLEDNVKGLFGGGNDLEIFHNGTNTDINNDTGDLFIRNRADDKDIRLQSDDGSGGTTDYIQLDGSEVSTKILTQKVIMSNLPTSDPSNAGQLYNDSGVLKVSAG